jgi:HAD superfamily hydrolase (TIGR01509 family)
METRMQALIFDVDGTLADTERDGHRIAFNRAFRDFGLNWYWDVPNYGSLLKVAGGKERICHYVRNFLPDGGPPDIDRIARDLHAAKTKHYCALVEGGRIRLRPGVSRLLREARAAGVRLAIATTTTSANVSSLLRSTLGVEAADWFECIAAGDIVTRKKPSPDIYLHVLERLGLGPEACIAFEDSGNGLSASRAAGIATVVTPTIYTATDDFAGALCVLSDLGEYYWRSRVLAGAALDGNCVDLQQLARWSLPVTSLSP